MRVVGIAIITALLSAGCAIQPGDPPTEGEAQRPNELVGLVNGDQPGTGARPQVQTRAAINQNGPQEDSPNPSPWTEQGAGAPPAGGGGPDGVPPGMGSNGSGNNQDNPNPSPWTNGASGLQMGVGGSGKGTGG